MAVVIKQDLDFECAVNPQTSIEKRFESALGHSHVPCFNDLHGEPFGLDQNRRGLSVARLHRGPQEIPDPRHIRLRTDPPVFPKHSHPASCPAGNHFHILQRQRNALDNDRGTENASASGVLHQKRGFGMVLVNHDLLLHPEEALKINQTVKELGSLLGIQGEFCPVLLGVDGKVADDLPVLLRKRIQLKRNRQIFPEMKLTQIIQISGIIPVVPAESHGKKGPLPLARHVRKIGFGIDGNGGFRRIENLLEKFRKSGKFQSGILRGTVCDLLLLRFDRVLRMMQACGHGVTAESIRIRLAGTGSGIWAIRKALHLHAGDVPLGIAEHRPQNARQGFMTAKQFPGLQKRFPLFENLLGGSLH